MRKIQTIFLTLIFLLLLSSCNLLHQENTEQPYLVTETIDVQIIDIERNQWWAAYAYNFEVTVTVQGIDYPVTKKYSFTGRGIYGQPKQWNYHKGDIVKAEMYTYIIASTGEVVSRTIHKVY